MSHGSVRGRERRLAVVVFVLLGLVFASLEQPNGFNQDAHYALVRALALGTPRIDRTIHEVGVQGSRDISNYRGHYFAAKAPGFALLNLPVYFTLEKIHPALFRPVPDPTRRLWSLGLWSVVLPAILLLFLVYRVSDSLEPGLGLATAATLGLGTLVLPFSTVFFSHVFAAALGFAAFWLLYRERAGAQRLRLVAGAGLLAGLAVTTEFPLALLGVLLGLYAAARPKALTRLGVYALAGLVGLIPLLSYNWWAFGSPLHLAYANVIGGLNRAGLFGVQTPSFSVLMHLFLARTGLLQMAPVLLMAAAGVVMLARQGRRAEALLITGVSVAYLLYDSAYWDPFGGASPGPRFLIPLLPFLALGLAPAYRRYPLTTGVLALASFVMQASVTLTNPFLAPDGGWFSRVLHRQFPLTPLSLVGLTGSWTIALFVLPAIAVIVLVAMTVPFGAVRATTAATAGLALILWGALAYEAPHLLERLAPTTGALTTLALLAAIATTTFLAHRVVPQLAATER